MYEIEIEVADARERTLRNVIAETGGFWGDGSPATDDQIREAVRDPSEYNIDMADLDGASEGEVLCTLNLRRSFGLPAFC